MFIEKLRKLSKAMQNEPDDIALINDTINSCADYV